MARPRKDRYEDDCESKISPLSFDQSSEMMMQIIKKDYPEFTGSLQEKLPDRAIGYLHSRFSGMTHHDTIETNNFSPIEVELWTNIAEFNSIMAIVKQAEASMLESKIWESDMPALQLAAIKSRKSEYRDNVQPEGDKVRNIRITIEGIGDFDTSASLKELKEGDSK